MGAAEPPVTVLLRAWREGDRAALEALMPIVYEEIRRVARHYMRREGSGHTLSATDLVSEAFLRLAGPGQPEWQDRSHFYAAAARQMRLVLVDHARERAAAKRGAAQRHVTFDEGLVGGERPGELVALDDALTELARVDERRAKAVELHYFGGLGHDAIGALLGVHANTVAKDLRVAQAWIGAYLRAP